MCVMLPWRVVGVDAEWARVSASGSELVVNRMLLPDLAIGDWVLVSAGMAVRQLSDEAATEITQILAAGEGDFAFGDAAEALR
jgi:hydrogenase assembly chaperone HypC/HupF